MNSAVILPVGSVSPIRVAVLNTSLNIGSLLDTRILSDVSLEIPGKSYPAHKVILALASDYFKALFTNGFKDPGAKVPVGGVTPKIMELYLNMIYNQEVVLYDWRDTIQLLEFAKFTQTNIPNRDNIVGSMIVPANEFVEYVQALSNLYEGEIPVEVIKKMNVYGAQYINFSDLGEEFVRSLIENNENESIKYQIANKAVSEGMSKDLYGLVQLEAIEPSLVTPESRPYLKQVNPELLSSMNEIAFTYGPVTVAIVGYRGIYKIGGRKLVLFEVKAKDSPQNFQIIFQGEQEYLAEDHIDSNVYLINSDGTRRNSEELKPGTVIRIIERHIEETIFVNKYEIVQ